MPVCNNCNGTEFECLDGKFFCVECDTQSQNFVDEQTTEVLEGGTFTTKRLKKRVAKSSIADKGLPWRTVEGFQLIIKAHVKALIDLGFTPSLDNVMQQIWFKFVHKSGMAVIDRNEGIFKTEDIKFRDFFLEQFKDDIIPNRAVSREVNIRVSRNAKKKSSGSTELESEEEWFSVDTEFEDADDNGDTDGSKTSLKVLNKAKTAPVSRYFRWSVPNRMQNTKIIAFCYLALRWCNEPVTIGDLFHWAEDGRLPYFASKECFLPHMKMSANDDCTFEHQKSLDYEKIYTMTLYLEKHLGMPALPKVNAMELMSRYLYQLNLPLSLAAYGINLLEQFNDNASFGSIRYVIKCMELRSAAIIIILLKLIFALNDQDEWSISEDCNCPTEHQNQEICHNFTWKNWVQQHLLYQREKLRNEYILFDNGDLTEVGDVHACMENYLSVVIKGTHIKCASANCHTSMKERSKIRSFTFARLVEKQGSADVKREVSEKLKHSGNLYELFGRCEGSHVDFSQVCRARFSKFMRTREQTYLRYKSRFLDDFHSSYQFLLKIMSCLTRASVLNIHECVWLVEKHTLVK